MVASGNQSASSKMNCVEDYLTQLSVVVVCLISSNLFYYFWPRKFGLQVYLTQLFVVVVVCLISSNLFYYFWPHQMGQQKGTRKIVNIKLPAARKKPEQEDVIDGGNDREPEQRGEGPVDTKKPSLREQLQDAILKVEKLENITKILAKRNNHLRAENSQVMTLNKALKEENDSLQKRLSESAAPSSVTEEPHGDSSTMERNVIYFVWGKTPQILKGESIEHQEVIKTLEGENFELNLLYEIEESENKILKSKIQELLQDDKKLTNRSENTNDTGSDEEDYAETYNQDKEETAGVQESCGVNEAGNEIPKQNMPVISEEAPQEIYSSNLKCDDFRKLLQEKDMVIENLQAENINLYCNFITKKSDDLVKNWQPARNNQDKTRSMEDGKNLNQIIPDEMDGFVDPSSCAYSCGYSVVFFILYRMGLRPCNFKMIREMDNQANIEDKNCWASLIYFVKLGILNDPKNKPVFFAKITDRYSIESALKDAHEEMKGHSHPAVLAMEYQNQELGHCVAIMSDGRTIIDVQKKRYWFPEQDKPVKSFNVVDVEQNAAKIWIAKCGPHYCVPPELGRK